MAQYSDTPTIAEEERYSDWTAQVHDELKARGLNVEEAYDYYSFQTAYYEFGDTPVAAVTDYVKWWHDNGECAA
jgi:hypothetical protein